MTYEDKERSGAMGANADEVERLLCELEAAEARHREAQDAWRVAERDWRDAYFRWAAARYSAEPETIAMLELDREVAK